MVRVQGWVQAGAQLSARAGETVTAVMAPNSKAIRTGWQAMPSPLLRYTPIPISRGYRPLGCGSTHENLTTTMPNPGTLEKKQRRKKAENYPRPCLALGMRARSQSHQQNAARRS